MSSANWFWLLFWLLVVSVVLLWRFSTVAFLAQTKGGVGAGLPTFYWNIIGDFFRAVKRAKTEKLPVPLGVHCHGLSFLLLIALIFVASIHGVN